jgi:hypothetical protein
LSSLNLQVTSRGAFVVALAMVLALTLLPLPAAIAQLGNDKVEHALAFLALALLGVLGWPGRGPWVGTALLILGAAIEILQGTSFIHRSMDPFDWFADGIGVLLGIGFATYLIRREAARA